MGVTEKSVRQTVTLPTKIAKRVRTIAKKRRLSANRVLVELVEEGIEARERREREFFRLTERLRSATDPREVERLGNELGPDGVRALMPRLETWARFPPFYSPASDRSHAREKYQHRGLEPVEELGRVRPPRQFLPVRLWRIQGCSVRSAQRTTSPWWCRKGSATHGLSAGVWINLLYG